MDTTHRLLKAIASDAGRHERELALVREPGARSSACAHAGHFASAQAATLDQLARNQCAAYARRFREWFGTDPESSVPHPVLEHQRSARLGRWGAKLLMSFEVAFAAWLTATLNFAQHLWVAMTVTAALWLAASTGLSHFVAMLLKRRAEVPQETRDRLHRTVRIFLVAWLAGAALMLMLRTAQGKTALVLAHATTFTLAAWAIATILLAGCGICADRLFGWSDDATREYYSTMRLRGRLAQLLEPSPEAAQLPYRAVSSTVSKMAIAVLAVGMLATSAARAQTVSSAAGAATAGCTYIDETASVQSGAAELALKQHATVLPALAGEVKSWCFVPFGSDAWTAEPATTVEFPAIATTTACGGVQKGEADVLFRGVREERQKKALQACTAERARSAARLEQELEGALSSVNKPSAQSARCSSVLDALDRAAHTPGLGYAVIVTDGQENCGAWRSVDAPASPMRSVVVLLPAANDGRAKESSAVSFAQRKAALLQAAPWITAVVPPWAFTPELLRSLTSSSHSTLARR